MEKSTVLLHLQEYLKNEFQSAANQNKRLQGLLPKLKSMKAEDISFGPLPTFFCAYLQCNSTGVGESSYQTTDTRTTVARDYQTDEFLFADGDEGTCQKGLELIMLKPGENIQYQRKSDIEKIAKKYGWQVHGQYFRSLNISMRDHRLNSCEIKYTKQPFKLPIRAIFGRINEDQKAVLGYVYEKDGDEYILIEINAPESENKATAKNLFFILLCIVFPPLILVYFIKKRWVG